MQHDDHEICLRGAIEAPTGRLHAVERNMVHRNQRGSKDNDLPVEIHQQKSQHHEYPEVKLQHAPCQLNLKRNERHQHKGQHIAADLAATASRVPHPRQNQQRRSSA